MGLLDSILGQSDYQYQTVKQNQGDETQQAPNQALQAQLGANGQRFGNQSAVQTGAATGNAAQIDNGQANNALNQQNQLVGQLQAQANGTGPSLAAGILKQGTDRTLAGQQASLASNPGINPALAARMQADNTVNANQQLAQASAQQRMQDQINAQNQLGSVLSGVRSQDQGQALAQAQLNQQANMQNVGNQQAANLFNASAANTVNQNNAVNSLGFDQATGQQIQNLAGNQQQYTAQEIQQNAAKQAAQQAQAQANAGAFGKLISGVAGGVGSVMTGGLSGVAGQALGAITGGGNAGTPQQQAQVAQWNAQTQPVADPYDLNDMDDWDSEPGQQLGAA